MEKNHSIFAPFMDQAVALAWKGRKKVAPNPMVGAMIVKDGKMIGKGYHQKWGGPHAEAEALLSAREQGRSVKGATLIVTLEPCAHHGKQGPCTELIRQAGIQRVIMAQKDPNPQVNGKGMTSLKKAGIETECLTTWESKNLNEIYLTNTLQKRPFIHLKTACTLEGKITLKRGTKTPLGNAKTMERVHTLRDRYDGILVGVETVLIDDPRLTARCPGSQHPTRLIVDSHLRTPPSAKLFKQPGRTVIFTTTPAKSSPWKNKDNVEIVACQKTKKGKVDLSDLLKKCFERNIRSILVEGGERINTSFLTERLVDRFTVIVCPKQAQNAKAPGVFDPEKIFPLFLDEVKLESVARNLWLDGFTKKEF